MAIYVESGVTSNDLVVQRNSVTVFDGGIVSNTTLNEFGVMVVSAGGSADNTTINSGGRLVVSAAAAVVSTTVNSGGSMMVQNPSETVLAIKENGGYVQVPNVRSATFVSNTISGLTLSGTSMTVHSNTVADGTVISSGLVIVYSGGSAKNTTVTANGRMHLLHRAFHRGTLQIESGAVVSATTGAIIDFDIINRTTDDGYMINDLSLIQGTPSYFISVSENQAAGTYKLAQGAASFKDTITIAGAQGASLGPVTVNGDNVVYNGVTYSLDQVDGNLTLTVIPKPAVFIIHYSGNLVSSSYEMTGAVVDSNYTMRISSGGVANDTTINTSAGAYVFDGGVANGTTVNAQGSIIISSGGVANDTTVNSTGRMHLVAGTASNTTVNAYGSMFMSSGAIHRGTLQIESGAAVNAFDCIIDFTVAGRTVEDDYLINDLSLIRFPVFTITVSENQTAGTYKLAQGASRLSNIAISIGTEDTVYGSITVNGSDFVYDDIIYSLDQVNGDLTLTITEVPKVFIYSDGTLISSGRTVTSAIMGKQTRMYISSGGTANSTTVSGGSMHISSGGTANKTSLDSGCVYVSTGGIANDTVIRRGVLAISSGGTANDTIMFWGNTSITSGGVANGTNMSGGWMYISGVANDTTVNASGNIDVAEGGVANDTTINTSGSMIVFSGAVANDTIVNSGGNLWLSSGAVANDTTLNSCGNLWLLSGAVANDTTLNTYGYISISSGCVANRTTINTSGSMTIFEGGVANDTVISCTTGNVLPYRGLIAITSGGIANNTIVVNGLVGNHGGAANNTTLNNNGSMGVDNGGVANNTTINAQGQMVLSSGAVANDTIVNSAGEMILSSGAVANDTIVNSGATMSICYGGKHSGTLQIEHGAIVYASSGTINFTVAGRTVEDDYLINNLSLIQGAPTYTITVSADQAYGTYKLAQGAFNFTGKKPIYIIDTVGSSFWVNGKDFIYNNSIVYSLDQVNGNLTLTIADLSSAVVIYNGGELVSSGAMISGAVISGKNNVMEVTSGGTASDTTINFRGNVYAYDGGYVVGTVVNSMGNLILENAIADSSVVNSGGQLLTGPNTVINHTDVNGGKVYIYDTSCVASDTVVRNGGTLAIEKGSALKY